MNTITYSAALRYALSEANACDSRVLLLTVSAEEAVPSESRPNELTLPLTEDAGLRFALGCARGGALPLLNLTAVQNGFDLIRKALASLDPADFRPIIIIADAFNEKPLPDLDFYVPATAADYVGALRHALYKKTGALIAIDVLTYDTSEVSDNPMDFFPPSYEAHASENAADKPSAETVEPAEEPDAETAEPESVEETAPSENTTAPFAETAVTVREEEPVDACANPLPSPVFACRTGSYQPNGLADAARLLGISVGRLADLCSRTIADKAEYTLETESRSGEILSFPPTDKPAHLWIGSDRMAMVWDIRQMTREEAAALFNTVRSRLESPLLLLRDLL